jgi:hypothetical protein
MPKSQRCQGQRRAGASMATEREENRRANAARANEEPGLAWPHRERGDSEWILTKSYQKISD